MKGILPGIYWLVLSSLAVASIAFGLVQLRHAPLPQAQARGLLTGKGIDPGFSQWVAGYTGGMRSVREAVRVQFTEPVDSAARQKALASSPFTLRPAVKGKLVWEDARTLAFQPDTLLPFGQLYGVELDMTDLFDIKTAKYHRFAFAFQTGPLRGRFTDIGMAADGKLSVTLQTSDYVPARLAEAAVTAQNLTSTPTWQHSADGLRHTAVYADPRGQEALDLFLNADLARLGGKGTAVKKIRMPPAGVFAPIVVEEVDGGEHTLRVVFSYPLDRRQFLKGLAFIKNVASPEAIAEGSELRIAIPDDANGDVELMLSGSLLAENGKTLGQDRTIPVSLHPALPGVRLPGTGYIVPETGDQAFVAFEARALRQANVELYRIYPNNVPEFLANNRFGEPQQTFYQKTLGRPVGKIVVDLPEGEHPGTYDRYRVDVSKYLADAPTALHFVRISFTPEQMRFPCPGISAVGQGMTPVPSEGEGPPPGYDDGEDYYAEEGGWRGSYEDNLPPPCMESYSYSPPQGIEGGRIQIGTYLLRSNLALQARAGAAGQVDIVATDIRTAEPAEGVALQLLSKQHQVLGQASTSADGLAHMAVDALPAPMLVVAKSKLGYAYLSLANTGALDYTAFADQLQGGGVEDGKQLKGFVYTERGTYRPGDTLHVGFILQGAEAESLQGPVVLEVTNARGGQVYKRSKTETLGHHYRWNVATDPSAPTGGYTLDVQAGGQHFYQRIGVEEIRPNRMAIQAKLSAPAYLEGSTGQADVTARYLYGTPAAGLRLSMRSTAALTDFAPAGFEGYTFRNYNAPEPDLAGKPGLILDGKTDEQGHATLPFTAPALGQKLAPVRLTLTTQIFEQGGQFSQQFSQTTVHPVPQYVGIKEKTKPEAGSYGINQGVDMEVALVDALAGKLAKASRTLTYTLTRLDWVWWYESVEGQSLYNGSGTQKPIEKGKVAVQNGRGQLSLSLPRWGRYALEITDKETGHSASQVIYVGYPDTDDQRGDPMQRLKLAADKKLYAPGDKARLRLPSAQVNEGDRVLVSLEAGNRSLSHTWAKVQKDGLVEVALTDEAAPNCFAHVTLIRPYAKTMQALPLRSYGLIGLEVRSADARLEPQLTVPQEGKPSQELAVQISEKNGQGMTYVLALVDEGLLNLTNFKTPDPAPVLGGRRGLAVRSFDVFGDVLQREHLTGTILGAAGGGDFMMAMAKREESRNSLAVEAVSRVRGPFTLKAGEKASHTLPAPPYAGAVRWMLIANTPKTAASTEALTRIKADIILEASLPRVASAGDEIALPLEIESFLKTNTRATLEAKVVSGPARLVGSATQSLDVAPNAGRKVVRMTLKMGQTEGMAVLRLTARAGSATAERMLRLPVRQPNRPQQRVSDVVLASGKALAWPVAIASATPGPMQAEIATAPPLGLTDRLNYLLQYPYGCAEQTVSAAVAQLYLPFVTTLSEPAAKTASANVQAAIQRLKRYELGSGLLALWPGMAQEDVAASAYACWFLQEAESRGHGQAAQLARLEKGLNRYLSNAASPRQASERNLHAFVLYCLGEKAEEGALNRLAQDKALPQQGHTLLAGAYLRRYDNFQARAQLASKAKPAGAYEGAYASPIRDLAIAASIDNSLAQVDGSGNRRVSPLLLQLAETVRTTYYLSTQELGWAFAALAGLPTGKGRAQATIAGAKTPVTAKSLAVDVAPGKAAPAVRNTGNAPLYAHLVQTYIPAIGKEPEAAEGLTLSVAYVDDLNRPIDPTRLKQGQSFSAKVTVHNKSGLYLDQIALSQPIPGGWEIANARLASSATGGEEATQPGLIYEDIRDDRVHRFFYLGNGKSITFRTRLTAAYQGRFALPSLTTEAMYLPRYHAVKKGAVVSVE